MPPRTVGPYEVLSVIGRGGVGTVYRARRHDTGEHVAVKLLGPPPACDPSAARRLAREYEALQGLHHPNVVRVYEAGVHEGYSFLAMELVEGLDLRSYLSPMLDEAGGPATRGSDPLSALDAWSSEPDTPGVALATGGRHGAEAIRAFAALMEEPETDSGPLVPTTWRSEPGAGAAAPGEAAPVTGPFVERLNAEPRMTRLRQVMLQVCDGLAYVHAHGLVHRDLKPSNIMVDDGRRVRLMDFGLVKILDDPQAGTQYGKVVGTYRYMAPEQARGDLVDHRADLYSVGVILFEMLCGRPPFVARRPADLWREIIGSAPPAACALNPGVDAALAAIAARLLQKDPCARFEAAEAIADAIRRARPGTG